MRRGASAGPGVPCRESAEQPAVGKAVAAAAALRDRLRFVYGLDAASVATGPPAAPSAPVP